MLFGGPQETAEMHADVRLVSHNQSVVILSFTGVRSSDSPGIKQFLTVIATPCFQALPSGMPLQKFGYPASLVEPALENRTQISYINITAYLFNSFATIAILRSGLSTLFRLALSISCMLQNLNSHTSGIGYLARRPTGIYILSG